MALYWNITIDAHNVPYRTFDGIFLRKSRVYTHTDTKAAKEALLVAILKGDQEQIDSNQRKVEHTKRAHRWSLEIWDLLPEMYVLARYADYSILQDGYPDTLIKRVAHPPYLKKIEHALTQKEIKYTLEEHWA